MIFTTIIKAIDPRYPEDEELKTWQGPNIEAISWTHAEQYLQENGLGYCEVNGILHSYKDEHSGEETIVQGLN